MCSSVFSDFKLSGVNSTAAFSAAQKNNLLQNNPQPKKKKESKTKEFIKQSVPMAVPLSGIPLTALIMYRISSRNISEFKVQLRDLTIDIKELRNKLSMLNKETAKVQSHDNKIWTGLIAAAGLAGSYKAGTLTAKEQDKVIENLNSRVNNVETTSNVAVNEAQKSAAGASTLVNKYAKTVNGVQLLDNPTLLTQNKTKYKNAIHAIENAAPMKLYDTPYMLPITSENPTLWSVTSEFTPIKEGGLGSVPLAIQENVAKLGIDNPAFIPMYQQKGKATLTKKGNDFVYKYGNNEIPVKKAAAFQMEVYRNGISSTENVEVFVGNVEKDSTKPPRQLIFIKNDNYFDGSIYQEGTKNEEPEKFAFFSKAVYEFAKMRADSTSVKNPEIPDEDLFNSIKEPEGFILNDWQASPVAALLRYKLPMENAYGQLSDKASTKLSQLPVITIGHNTMYQGSTLNSKNDSKQTKEATSNVLNTLFDNYTYDIVSNAKTLASTWDKDDINLRNLDNVLLIDKDNSNSIHTNLLNMGICLSDYFHPVSKNYAYEIISNSKAQLSGELRWALTRRNDTDSLVGIINGNDFNKLSIKAKEKEIKDSSGLEKIETYDKNSDIKDVMAARTANKIALYKDFIKPFSMKNDENNDDTKVQNIRKKTEDLEFVEARGRKKKLPELSNEELANTPVITSVGRLVSQKGVETMCNAIELLMKNWHKDFPDKPKPIFYIGGRDGENGQQRPFIEELQNDKLSREDSNRIVFMHGMAPMATLTAASDFFLLPSNFEPCGLTQSEAFALGTPVIGSSVGGIVDTVNRSGKTNGVLTKLEPKLTAEALYDAMKKGLEVYFKDKNAYARMVNDALNEDFSWIQPGKKGPVFDYLNYIGIDTKKLPDVMQQPKENA